MKNYAALVAKLQNRNLPLPRDYFAVSVSIMTQYTRAKLGVTGIISIWQWAKNTTNVSLHSCIFAIKHFFDKSLQSQPLLHVFCCKK